MTRTYTFYPLRLLCLLLFIACIFASLQGKAQKKATAYLANPVVYVNLMLPSADSLLLVDGTGALYANYSAGVDEYDAGKLPNFNENICLSRDGHNLAIEARPLPKNTDTLFIRMWGMHQPIYTLQVKIKGIASLLPFNGWLIDNYLHTQTPVNLLRKTEYNFNTAQDANTYLNRFMIVFEHGFHRESNNVSTNNAGQLNAPAVSVYPNPVKGNNLTLNFKNMPADNYTVKLSNLSGRIFSSVAIMHYGGDNQYYLSLNSVYSQGIYSIAISGKKTEKIIHLPIIINK